MIDNLTEAIKTYENYVMGAEATSKALRKEGVEKDAKYYEDTANFDKQIIAWLEELKARREADRWNVIHTEADLPKESDNYLIQLDNNWNEQLTAFFSKGVGFCFMGSVLKDVIAWRNLPKPYESEATNEEPL